VRAWYVRGGGATDARSWAPQPPPAAIQNACTGSHAGTAAGLVRQVNHDALLQRATGVPGALLSECLRSRRTRRHRHRRSDGERPRRAARPPGGPVQQKVLSKRLQAPLADNVHLRMDVAERIGGRGG
jgi:hypothetical protein